MDECSIRDAHEPRFAARLEGAATLLSPVETCCATRATVFTTLIPSALVVVCDIDVPQSSVHHHGLFHCFVDPFECLLKSTCWI
jgi:hypothetical protein